MSASPDLKRGRGCCVYTSDPCTTLAYVRGADGICRRDFFTRMNVGDAVAARLVDLPAHLPGMRACLATTDLPDVEPGSQCETPYGCEFHDRCTANKPNDWISYLPYLTLAQANALKVLEIEAISAIPADFPLTWKPAIIRDATASGQPYV